MTCRETLRVQAYFDGEVDAPSAAEIERHLESCAECRAALDDLERSRSGLRRDFEGIAASPALRARILRALDEESGSKAGPVRQPARSLWRSRPFWLGAFGGMGTMAAAATLAFILLSPALNDPLLDSLLGEHVSSLMPGHLISVESSDHHTVKPWFAGHADVSPAVADFSQQGFQLVGGRAEYLEKQRAAVVVYRHGLHVINVFSWAQHARGLEREATRNGYHLAFWQSGDLQYCAVSDADWTELRKLKRLLLGSSSP